MPNCSAPQKVVRATFVPLPGRGLRQGNAIAPPLREDAELWCKWNRRSFKGSSFSRVLLLRLRRGTA
ncbi:hypothetical protein CN204_04770 [Sinorhizobium meliloti]|nr:hypothetical protein CN204_04770 [Sinorhizobium meliloti]RVM26470.1 hypothetical protein CN132_16105 [Sinorhizobium meliloti]RVN34859.1 hypothetical protein CN113_34590 [Sinorhizobium meliloti]RVN98008.1 hypothetical protein CN102_35165 [Sinorhizobium meliloti]